MKKRNLIGLSLIATTLLCSGAIPEDPPEVAASNRISMPQAMVLGAVEGLTEYLPVSSTGHLILAVDALQLGGFAHDENGDPITGPFGPIMEPNPAVNAFNIVIQFGAILAVFGIYLQRIREMLLGLVGKHEEGRKLLKHLIIAFCPAAIIGFFLDKPIETYLFSPLTVALALAIGGVVMVFEKKIFRRDRGERKGLAELTLRSALIIGFVQCLAMWPGTSRSMVTILAGLGVGLSMTAAAEFSFLLALPTLTAATLYKTVTQWDALTEFVGIDSLITGIVISGIVAGFSVKFLVQHLTKHGLSGFGFYRIGLAIGIFYYFTK